MHIEGVTHRSHFKRVGTTCGTKQQSLKTQGFRGDENLGVKALVPLHPMILVKYNNMLARLVKALPAEKFMRIHRSYIINIDALSKIESFEKNSYRATLLDGNIVPISRTAYPLLKSTLGL